MWRYHPGRSRRPEAGWKLHVSATILNAPAVFAKVAPLLIRRGVWFKAPRSLDEVLKLNSGLIYNYSQIGKIITVYPANDREAIYLAQKLHQLTRRFRGPAVPFDLAFSEPGSVFYRFGAFHRLEIEHQGRPALGLPAPDGSFVPDIREQPKPDWVTDPFLDYKPPPRPSHTRSRAALRVMKVLTQRGKGGVYEAIDFSGDAPHLCLLKEGRRDGEVAWDGRDGAWRVRHEKRVLATLAARGVPVPRVHASFGMAGNYYLVMDYIAGRTLHDHLLNRRHRFELSRIVDWGIQLATFLAQMHAAGWAWRDCKPKNLLLTHKHRLVPIDFEGAAPIRRPDPALWGTPGFTPPDWKKGQRTDGATDDCYALGAMIYFLLTGRLFDYEQPVPVPRLRRNVYPELVALTESLLHSDRRQRPTAQTACTELMSISSKYSGKRTRARDVKAA
jgi:hypothetical protein